MMSIAKSSIVNSTLSTDGLAPVPTTLRVLRVLRGSLRALRGPGLALLLVLPLLAVQGCGLRERRETYRAEREALADTVARIHSAQLRILTREVPPELISPRVIEVFERSGSIQELHEQSENILELVEKDVRLTETEIADLEQEIEKRRGNPNPYADLNAARARKQELDFELLRVENLRWRGK